MDTEDIPALFVGEFNGLDNCESLCKKAASYCKKFVKDAASCEKENVKGSAFFFEKTSCDQIEDKEERKECKQFANEIRSEGKQGVESEKDEALSSCDDYQADCIADCTD